MKLKSELDSSNVNLRMMQRRLQTKDKEIAKYKAKIYFNSKNLYDLSDD